MVIEKKQNQQEGYSLVSNSANTMETLEYTRKYRNVEGMGWLVTCLFIVGETAGGGLIAMPTAMVSAGLIGGVFIILLGAITCAYTGNLLSENWTILQSRWPEYRNHCRKPYPAMGLRALGPRFMTVVSTCLNVTQFGTAVVFLLLASKNLESFLHAHGGVQVGFCYIIIIVAVFMLPFTMLKSPKDFWWAVIGAMVTTSIAVSLLVYGSFLDMQVCTRHVNYPGIEMSKFFMCFGTVMFAYGGHGAFPTIQHDMKRPYHFKRAVWLAFLIIFLMYLPVSVFGYIVYGDSLRDSVIPSIQSFHLQQLVNVLITLHVILALTIIFNPLNQEWEELLKVPHEMGFGRVAARTVMMAFVVVVALTVPNFGVLLDLVGGSTITLMALVFPVVFNLYLTTSKQKHGGTVAAQDEKPPTLAEVWKYTSTSRKLINFSILLFALVGGGAATISAANAMLNSEFSAPCYAGVFSSQPFPNSLDEAIVADTPAIRHSGMFNCCGIGKNISRFENAAFYCLDPAVSVSHGSHG
ncbi:Amino acid transporter, transmembrane family-containing protein [Aphelenchoides besseyi]|nr:Amino acid transporter, transmembrane family-containing protein [Aphelenchoides besseyi]KAI6235044.1 Amino acid transporter, transmembrane family-containing protein [Aphelenchoides besseyi]